MAVAVSRESERRDRRGNAAGIEAGIELGDRTRPADTTTHVVPEDLTPDTKGRDHADAGDRNLHAHH